MTRNNWIACAILASAAAIGACSPKGGEAGQPDRAVDQQNQASDQNYTAHNPSDLPVSFTVPTGTKLDLTLDNELSSRKNKAGDTFTAKVSSAIRDASGAIVIDEGTTVNGSIVAVKPAPNRRTPGSLTIALSTVEVNGSTFPIRAMIDSVPREFGQVISKSPTGTAIGVVAGQTTNLDIVIPDSTHVLVTITEPMKVDKKS